MLLTEVKKPTRKYTTTGHLALAAVSLACKKAEAASLIPVNPAPGVFSRLIVEMDRGQNRSEMNRSGNLNHFPKPYTKDKMVDLYQRTNRGNVTITIPFDISVMFYPTDVTGQEYNLPAHLERIPPSAVRLVCKRGLYVTSKMGRMVKDFIEKRMSFTNRALGTKVSVDVVATVPLGPDNGIHAYYSKGILKGKYNVVVTVSSNAPR